jgi:energy-coupling factor transporter ATP-binding protein EcfA2
MELLVENVRCFEGKHHIPIKRLTLLVGENSSGKSTLLAMLAGALSPHFPTANRLFNADPFELGTYDTIASYRGGAYGRAKHFSLGLSRQNQNATKLVNATYVNKHGQPELSNLSIHEGAQKVVANFEPKRVFGEASLVPQGAAADAIEHFTFSLDMPPDFVGPAQTLLTSAVLAGAVKASGKHRAELIGTIISMTVTLQPGGESAIAVAPIRTRPRRTYDKLGDEFRPEGDHVPGQLDRYSRGDERDERLWEILQKFGKESGLFSAIDVKKLGGRPADPFQIRVRTQGPWVNLADVGYGVSQSLPIIVESAMASKNKILLLQQPEVHLHPKAQAALGSFLVEMASNKRAAYVVETHSDYLLDRIRIDVAAGKIPANEITILFLDRAGMDTTVYPLSLDSTGNIESPPPTFRTFFLSEQLRLLSRGQ